MRFTLWIQIPFLSLSVQALIEFTNIKCYALDKSFAEFEYCYIRSVNRTYKYFSLKVNLFKVPIDNVTVGVDIRKRANGYKPFLYNISVDACQFLRSKSNPLYRFIFSFLDQRSNINHSCPYDHDIIVEKMDVGFVNSHLMNSLPAPGGDYAILSSWSVYNVVRARVELYASLS